MIREILKVPDSRLTALCHSVAQKDLNCERLAPFIQDLFDTMYANDGIGLAAPQVGVLQRIFVMDVRDGKKPHNPICFINPEILVKMGESVEEESCLSIPDVAVLVHRPYSIAVAAKNVHGDSIALTLRGLEARVFCHEEDHLSGTLMTERALSYAVAGR